MTANTAYTASSHEATKNSFSRRALIGGTAALGAVGLLSACGNGSASAEKTKAAGAGANIKDLYNINAQDVNSLKKGGTLRLPSGSIGPNFNVYTQSGNTGDNTNVMSTIGQAGLWLMDFDGTYTLNKDFAVSFTPGKSGDKIQVAIKLNPKAVFNDGTPINYKALQSTWNIFKSLDNGYNIVSSGIYEFVESVEKTEDDYSVMVTFSKPYYPLQSLFAEILHPAMEDVELFNNGFVDNPHPEYWAGPFTLADKGWDSTAKTFSVVPSDKWWGTKPLLEKIVFTQMESSAARAAFKNDEIDAIGANTSASYTEVKSVAGAELRKGTRLYAGGLDINPRRVKDAALRKAIFAGVNREALAKIQFQGLPYEESIPGSMLHMPFSPYYQDNYPTPNNSVSEAQKILEAAGYAKKGDYYEKDGQKASCAVVVFGDDPTTKGKAQTFTQQMKDVGIEIRIDQRADSEFASVLGNWDYDISFSGYGVSTPDATEATKQFYYSENNDGNGSKEIDALIDAMTVMEDDKARNLACNEIEKKHMAEFAFLGTITNGPDFMMAKKTLANYGPSLYKSTDWTAVGWMNS
ncbi:MAG: ABC transporter family substrate-binding protein [Rothia mucilaginosa]|uniref:ABC transporter family substrate-binding protein n=1 Tax=Rothia mucilaginosa TaxID=43675 RepID=A0A943TCU7_9MICC|nr:ABC transporter substrate-binding protein [Rothia mucilaginosa]MBS6433104.1 ABC transporter family substrate-binding protein [Rothia mucilaginosa]MBS6634887.1 ABC transporter family substrate-binding protein [Rothia mucilaginosa]